ncbi:hypothetical protein [Pseudonocardia lacus]|uniref:hypothetical protein n=1 Tax=Pseudonocardia lacus TaxID=2835865 RepID=UPI001BDC1042|nr:hypothetical protein [Pseudonocardia lacus]
MDETDLIDQALRPLAGARFYRGNALRRTGLAPGATSAQVRRRRTEVEAAARLGMAAPPGAAGPPCGPEPSASEVAAAFDDVRREPVLRLVHELLWVWSGDDELSAAHDAVVREHCALLTEDWPDRAPGPRTPASDARWAEVLGAWARLLERDDLWAWARRRAAELADPRLTDEVVERLRSRVPQAVLAVNVDIAAHAAATDPEAAARHVAVLRASPLPADLVDAVLVRRARTTKREVSRACEAAADRAAADVPSTPGETTALLDATRTPLRVLAALLGHSDPSAAASRDEVAGVVVNAAIRYYEHTTVDRRARAAAVRPQLRAAEELAADPHLRERVAENLRILARNDEVIEHNVRNSFGLALPDTGRSVRQETELRLIAERREQEERAERRARLAEREERLRIAREERERKAAAEREAQAQRLLEAARRRTEREEAEIAARSARAREAAARIAAEQRAAAATAAANAAARAEAAVSDTPVRGTARPAVPDDAAPAPPAKRGGWLGRLFGRRD